MLHLASRHSCKPLRSLRLIRLLTLALALDLAGSLGFYLLSSHSHLAEIPAFAPNTAFVVFCAGIEDGQGIDRETKARIEKAGQILREKSQRLVLLGCHWKQIQGKPTMQDYALYNQNLLKEQVLADQRSYDTITNLQELGRLVRLLPEYSFVILSSPLHIFRIRHLLADAPWMKDRHVSYYSFLSQERQGFAALWKELHHEAIAWFLYLVLPDEIYRRLMAFLRVP